MFSVNILNEYVQFYSKLNELDFECTCKKLDEITIVVESVLVLRSQSASPPANCIMTAITRYGSEDMKPAFSSW